MSEPDFTGLPPQIELTYKNLLLRKDLEIECHRSKQWQKLAGRYDDIRYALRNCDDDPAGHAEFYKECCLIIFGEYRDETRDDYKDDT
jgi:hypothetical protein